MANQRLSSDHHWVLRCYGSGDTRKLIELAARYGIDKMVEFHSFLGEAELASAYRNADAFVLASRKETYGVVLHEAAASGLPLVASEHAGATELLAIEGENAFRIYPEDTGQFALALESIIADGELRQRFGRKSRDIAEYWDVKENARRTSKWLQQLE